MRKAMKRRKGGRVGRNKKWKERKKLGKEMLIQLGVITLKVNILIKSGETEALK
jgi:hypothetical protein